LRSSAVVSELLVGRNWQAQSATLAGSNLTATFMPDGRFNGFLTADDFGTIPAQRISGTWRVVGPNLFLNYTYNTHADTGYTLQVIPTPAEMVIEINSASESELLGVDGWKRVWVWQPVR
jgi:hypothetical protein